MKKMIFWMMVVGVTMLLSAGALCGSVSIKCTVAGGNPIYYLSAPTLATGGWLVQVITADSSAITLPDADGNPMGTNYLTTTPPSMITSIGASAQYPSYGNGEYNVGAFKPSPVVGKYIFIRVWNASTVGAANKYGNSSPAQVTELAATLYYTPESFSINLPKPGPEGPTWLIGTGETTSSIKWTWNSVPGADNYELCSSEGTFIATVDATSTVESGLSGPNVKYIRMVKANIGTVKSSPSSNYSAYTMANIPLIGAATGGWKLGQGSYVTVTWGKNSNPNFDTTYQVKRSNGTTVGTTTEATMTDVGRNPNTLCTYEVLALNKNGTKTAPNDRVSATTPPGKPTPFSVSSYTTNEMTCTWEAVLGANSYNFYRNGTWIPTTEIFIKSILLDPCSVIAATVEAVSAANGTGEPAALNKWTRPSVPHSVGGATSPNPDVNPKSCDLSWDDDNINAVYYPEYSLNGVDNFITKDAVTTDKFKNGVPTNYAEQEVWWRIRAMNGNTPFPGDYSGYSTPLVKIKTSALGSGGGVGNTPIISQVKFNGRNWRPGATISSRPTITAIVTCDSEVDTSFRDGAVWVDENQPAPAVEFSFDGADVTYEAVPGSPTPPPYTWQITVRCSQAIPALPQSQHYLKIKARDVNYTPGEWLGLVGVGSGGVQMIGAAYNYPNPFRPLSTDPNQNTTRISYNLNVDAAVTLIIYDISGHEVYRKAYRSGTAGGQAGLNSVPFSGTSMFGDALGNGMYLYKLISGGSVIGSGKLVILD